MCGEETYYILLRNCKLTKGCRYILLEEQTDIVYTRWRENIAEEHRKMLGYASDSNTANAAGHRITLHVRETSLIYIYRIIDLSVFLMELNLLRKSLLQSLDARFLINAINIEVKNRERIW